MTAPGLPFSGRSATARACSLQGAEYAAEGRAVKTQKVLAMLRESGARGLTRHDLNRLTGIQIPSLCSILDALVESRVIAESGKRISGPYRRECTVYVRVQGEGRAA